MNAIEKRVAKGVEWLDANEPDSYEPYRWHDQIDVELLDLAHPCLCILGQIWGNYFAAVKATNVDDASLLGFNLRDSRLDRREEKLRELDALEVEWRRVITARREAARTEQ